MLFRFRSGAVPLVVSAIALRLPVPDDLSRWSDEELILKSRECAAADRRRLLDELVSRHYRRVALWCLRWTGDRDQAADLAQDVFLKVHRCLDSFEGGARFTTWLYTVCRNHCINAGMASRAREHVELDESIESLLASPGPCAEEGIDRAGRVALARRMLTDHLDETERRVLLLHYVEGYSVPAVTRMLSLENASGAKAFLVSAHRKLKTAVERLQARSKRAS